MCARPLCALWSGDLQVTSSVFHPLLASAVGLLSDERSLVRDCRNRGGIWAGTDMCLRVDRGAKQASTGLFGGAVGLV